MFKILGTDKYFDWYTSQNLKIKAQVNARIERIVEHEHFGDAKHLSKNLAELRWKNGLRVYFSMSVSSEYKILILLIGGTKKSQKNDIRKAKKLILELSKV